MRKLALTLLATLILGGSISFPALAHGFPDRQRERYYRKPPAPAWKKPPQTKLEREAQREWIVRRQQERRR
ncbi:hypothetical protein EDC14_100747 [Hydrogenispora ethanolica]|uniref:Uncharacterized protein n=1 Tax=Hydrogenispora ethanolica TaxID=1082276 RepID=A0A4R1RXU9_HYDET|nr:hypothetical protein [Hydrogenispora ethanolica]TCL71585.1 hypothetical protein EDC14_100747 [Hydrogenispora ethanolica]